MRALAASAQASALSRRGSCARAARAAVRAATLLARMQDRHVKGVRVTLRRCTWQGGNRARRHVSYTWHVSRCFCWTGFDRSRSVGHLNKPQVPIDASLAEARRRRGCLAAPTCRAAGAFFQRRADASTSATNAATPRRCSATSATKTYRRALLCGPTRAAASRRAAARQYFDDSTTREPRRSAKQRISRSSLV